MPSSGHVLDLVADSADPLRLRLPGGGALLHCVKLSSANILLKASAANASYSYSVVSTQTTSL